MVLGKRWLFSIWNGAEIRPLEMGRKSPAQSMLGHFPVFCGRTSTILKQRIKCLTQGHNTEKAQFIVAE